MAGIMTDSMSKSSEKAKLLFPCYRCFYSFCRINFLREYMSPYDEILTLKQNILSLFPTHILSLSSSREIFFFFSGTEENRFFIWV